jgi:hypothetical protein
MTSQVQNELGTAAKMNTELTMFLVASRGSESLIRSCSLGVFACSSIVGVLGMGRLERQESSLAKETSARGSKPYKEMLRIQWAAVIVDRVSIAGPALV